MSLLTPSHSVMPRFLKSEYSFFGSMILYPIALMGAIRLNGLGFFLLNFTNFPTLGGILVGGTAIFILWLIYNFIRQIINWRLARQFFRRNQISLPFYKGWAFNLRAAKLHALDYAESLDDLPNMDAQKMGQDLSRFFEKY